MHTLHEIVSAAWMLLEQSSLYILLGLVIGGMLKVFLSPDYVARHLGSGSIRSVFKATMLGIPLPLCSCGVLPAAAELRKQGANKGATTAFLIATPESGIDSITVSWALLDPLMTVARPVAAFFSAMTAGIIENLLSAKDLATAQAATMPSVSLARPVCTEQACGCGHPPASDNRGENQGWLRRIGAGMRYAANDIWGDLAGWFFLGVALAACITILVPSDWLAVYLGGGLSSMLLMLLIGIPMYICATASTPIAAALILKGVSPGAALVFLLAGPATNIAALAVLVKILGKKGVVVYLLSIAVISVLCGLGLDALYFFLGISAMATVGEITETIPHGVMLAATGLLLVLTLSVFLRGIISKRKAHD